ncbi:MAG: ABC-2 family transporter protein [Pseudomonadota bacterium]|nr:ABC-2 family transporter protein [Pseudomonadota bacterium]
MRRGVFLALVRVALMTAMQYRASFLLEFCVGLGTTVGVALPLMFVYDHTGTVAGWTLPEALLVGAFFLVLQALVGGLVEPNLGALVEGVRSGQLDYLLLKPPDAQFVASFQRVAPARLWDLLGGLVVGAYALSHLPTPSVADAFTAAGLLLAGLTAVYGLWVLVICTSFWFVRVDNLRYLLGAVVDAGRWPVSIYTGWVRVFLTVFVPVALVTSYPALALLGRLDAALAAQAVAVGLGMLVVSRVAWVQALRHYTSASS